MVFTQDTVATREYEKCTSGWQSKMGISFFLQSVREYRDIENIVHDKAKDKISKRFENKTNIVQWRSPSSRELELKNSLYFLLTFFFFCMTHLKHVLR